MGAQTLCGTTYDDADGVAVALSQYIVTTPLANGAYSQCH